MLSERAAAYVRVSSQRQADEGVSIDAQIRRIKQYAQFKGLTLKDEDIFIDRAVSGGIPIWLRPQGGALHRLEIHCHLIQIKYLMIQIGKFKQQLRLFTCLVQDGPSKYFLHYILPDLEDLMK